MSVLKWLVNFFSNFASFFIVTTHNSPVDFKLINFLLWMKGPNKSANFETSVCSCEILPKSSCHFPNQKSVFLQILHHPLVSWNITPLYFFSSNIIYLGQKQSIKVQIFQTQVLKSKFVKFLLSVLKRQVNSSSDISSFFNVMSFSEPQVSCLGKMLYTLHERNQSKCNFFRLLSARIKIHQILVIFETTNLFFFKFCIILQYHEIYITPVYLFSWNFIYFQQKEPIKYKFGEISPEQSKVWNFAFWWAPFVKII